MKKNTISVVIPCFNEQNYIEKTINDVLNKTDVDEIIFVDDASTDKSVEIVKNIKNSKIKIVKNFKNLGKGETLKNGFDYVTSDIIVIQDADNEYLPEDINELIIPFYEKDADFVIGNRFQSIKYRKIGYFIHTLFNKIITLMVNLKTNNNFCDVECGYKAFKSNILKRIDLKEKSFGFEIELLIKVAKMKVKIFEVAVSYNARKYSEGKKIKFIDALRAFYCLIKY